MAAKFASLGHVRRVLMTERRSARALAAEDMHLSLSTVHGNQPFASAQYEASSEEEEEEEVWTTEEVLAVTNHFKAKVCTESFEELSKLYPALDDLQVDARVSTILAAGQRTSSRSSHLQLLLVH